MNLKKGLKMISAAIVMTQLLSCTMNYATEGYTPLKIVALGDSIAKGTGLNNEDTQAYGAILAKNCQAKFDNLAFNGQTSNQLIDNIQSGQYDDEIKSADVIVLSIGSNDLLKPFMKIIAQTLQLDPNSANINQDAINCFYQQYESGSNQIMDQLHTLERIFTDNSELQDICNGFEDRLHTIMKEIKCRNNNVVIYVNNLYNPYVSVRYHYGMVSVFDLGNLAESYILAMNHAFVTDSDDYQLIGAYTMLRQNGLLNVVSGSLDDMSQVNLDPHPNAQGHEVIAREIYRKMDTQPPVLEISDAEKESFSNRLGSLLIRKDRPLVLKANEWVRAVRGKKIYLRTDSETYSYTLTGDEVCEEAKNGQYFIRIKEADWSDGNSVPYKAQLNVSVEKDSFKDAGNNSIQNTQLGVFSIEKDNRFLLLSLAASFVLVIFIISTITGFIVREHNKNKI